VTGGKNPRDRHARFRAQHSRLGIEREHPVQPLEVDDTVLIVERGVAIRASGATRYEARRVARDDGLQLGELLGPVEIAFGERIAAPSCEHVAARFRVGGRIIR
jgi:hypothetical protein